MRKTVTVQLTKSEIELLYNLICENMETGAYYGNRLHFMARQEKVLEKLTNADDKLKKNND